MSALEEICTRKREHVEHKKVQRPLSELKSAIGQGGYQSTFIQTIKSAQKTAIIAEVKKASPSKGIIRDDFDPVNIAKTYEKHGASCLSVLTDTPYFQGQDSYFEDIRQSVSLPLLRKDFMIDPYQIYESRALGADCILLIMAALDDETANSLYTLSEELGMDVLVEVHDEKEMKRALRLNARMIGVNNRNLKTLEVDVKTSFALSHLMPEQTVKIAESGLSKPETLEALKEAGYDGFLIGESLMRQPDIGHALDHLIQKST